MLASGGAKSWSIGVLGHGVPGSTGNLPVLFGSVAETVFPGSARALACYFRRLAEMLFYSTKESRWRGANDSTRGACAPQRQIEHEDEASAGDEWF